MKWSGLTAAFLLIGCTFDSSGLPPDTSGFGQLDLGLGDFVGELDLNRPDVGLKDSAPDLHDPTDLSLNPPDLDPDAGGSLFIPANLSSAYWSLGQTDLTISATVAFDTTTGTSSSGSFPSGVGVYGTPNYCIITLKKLVISKNGKLEVEGKRPLIILAKEEIEIDGLIDISAMGVWPGPGGSHGGTSDKAGQGCGGGYKPSESSAGAGGSFGGYGGKGGDGAKGKAPCHGGCNPTQGHCVSGCLTPLHGGSGGAGGGTHSVLRGGGGKGGGGGGALQLTSGKSILIKKGGRINAGGGGGQGGSTIAGSGGGGGSGGGILLEAPAIKVDGIVAANGGGGGGGAITTSGGKSGGAGAATTSAAAGGGAPSVLWDKAGAGGNGSAEKVLGGSEGKAGSGVVYGRGGGGGGAGRICIRTSSGTVDGSAKISPISTKTGEAYAIFKLPP